MFVWFCMKKFVDFVICEKIGTASKLGKSHEDILANLTTLFCFSVALSSNWIESRRLVFIAMFLQNSQLCCGNFISVKNKSALSASYSHAHQLTVMPRKLSHLLFPRWPSDITGSQMQCNFFNCVLYLLHLYRPEFLIASRVLLA